MNAQIIRYEAAKARRYARADARYAWVMHVASEFEASGVAYTCGAVVLDYARPLAVEATQSGGPLVDYRFDAGFSVAALSRAVWDEVHFRSMKRCTS